MTDIVLRDIDDVLADRIRRVAELRSWTVPTALLHLLEQGLHAYEGDGRLRFEDAEANVFQEAIAALEVIPDAAFSRIGQVDPPGGTA
jgi:hypothetical protein